MVNLKLMKLLLKRVQEREQKELAQKNTKPPVKGKNFNRNKHISYH